MSLGKSFPFYAQFDSVDCGPTCLRMIAKYYGRSFPLQYLREKCFITRLGVSMLGISDAAEYIGFRTMSVKCNFAQLVKDAPIPCILHWNQKHFVVCYEIKKRKLFSKSASYIIKIADPAGDKYTMTEAEFLKCWISTKQRGEEVGSALLLIPTPSFYNGNDDLDENKKKRNLSYYLGYLKPHKSQFLQLIAGMIITSAVALISPFLTQAVVDYGIGNNDLNFITLILVAELVITVTMMCVGFLENWISLYINAHINISLISDFLIKLMKLPLRFFDTKNIGDILQRIGDHGRIESFLTGTSMTSLFSLINFIIFAFVMAYFDLKILLIFFVGNTFYVAWILSFMRYRRKLDFKGFSQAAAEQSNLYGLIIGMQDIKLNNCEKQQRWKWERIQIKLFKIGIEGVSLQQIQSVGATFFSQVTNVLISYFSAKAVVTGEITLGMMVSIGYIIGQLSAPIGQLIQVIHSFQDAKISLERLNEIHNKEDEEQDMDNKIIEMPKNKTIVLNDLYFSYSGSNRDYVLKGINLIIPQNKVTAIVGESGSGKTTIVKLLLGFYESQKGDIKIGDTWLNEIHSSFWRSRVGAVLQDSFIFSDTIAYNIAPGVEDINKERLQYAVEIANIKNYIESLPLKYNTKIGMEGTGLSQGQKQRLLIARAVYKDPDLILFDEATNALDAVNEATIMNNLDLFYKNRTVVIVAHRLSTVKKADKIVVMDGGQIVEEGTHAELTQRKGIYYTLVKNQLELGG